MRFKIFIVGDIDSTLISRAFARVRESINVERIQIQYLPSSFIVEALNAKRNQYQSDRILSRLRKLSESDVGDIVLALVDVDLYTHDLNFIFGQAEAPSKLALVSLYRLHPPEDAIDGGMLASRLAKEVIHEVGHTLGLGHCSNMRCVMFFSNTLHDTDRKSHEFCSLCHSRL